MQKHFVQDSHKIPKDQVMSTRNGPPQRIPAMATNGDLSTSTFITILQKCGHAREFKFAYKS